MLQKGSGVSAVLRDWEGTGIDGGFSPWRMANYIFPLSQNLFILIGKCGKNHIFSSWERLRRILSRNESTKNVKKLFATQTLRGSNKSRENGELYESMQIAFYIF